jgi:ferredoxin-NADP reductase
VSRSKQSPLLFIAGGSGITPMLGLITQALAQSRTVTLLYYHRTSLAKSPFQAYWQHLATAYPYFAYYMVNTADPNNYSSQLAGSRHLDVDTLSLLPLSLAESTIFACGSSSLLAGLYRALETLSLPSDNHTLAPKRSLRDNVIVERFGTELPDSDMSLGTNEETADIAVQTVYLRGRQQQFSSGTTLLLGAEQAGIRLSYGCRQGICQLCRCQKISGVVKNIQTGKLSSHGVESIQTCINIPMTEVILDV